MRGCFGSADVRHRIAYPCGACYNRLPISGGVVSLVVFKRMQNRHMRAKVPVRWRSRVREEAQHPYMCHAVAHGEACEVIA